jgi:hypothetical protein
MTSKICACVQCRCSSRQLLCSAYLGSVASLDFRKRGLRWTLGWAAIVSCVLACSSLVCWEPPALAASISSESVLAVSSDGATFRAQVNPEGAETTCTFVYGASTGPEMTVPIPEKSVGSGSTIVTVEARAQSLLPSSTYHVHVVLKNLSGTVVNAGENLSFTTQSPTSSMYLPDSRQWELVSPANKYGAGIEPMGFAALQASSEGGAISYSADAPIVANPPANLVGDTQVLSIRGPHGWSSQDIATPNTEVTTDASHNEYQLFSASLSFALVEPLGETPLSRETSGPTIYLRDDISGSYSAVAESSKFVDATPNLNYLIFREDKGKGIWELSAGKESQLVSVLPEDEGSQLASCSALGYQNTDVRHAVSTNGSLVIWETFPGSSCGPLTHGLFIRNMVTHETIRLDTLQNGSGGSDDNPRFQTASSDGSDVFFTDEEALTPASTASPNQPDLYEFYVTSGSNEKLAGILTDLTIPDNASEHADVQGVVVGASEDGSYLYYVAKGVLAPNAHSGEFNLYMMHNDTTTFIGDLSPEDVRWEQLRFGGDLAELTARVSPDGHYLAFMSNNPLTGYDNLDASNNESRDEEVFLWDADTDRLVCVSCNPTGAQPNGLFDSEEVRDGTTALVDRGDIWTDHWLAGSIPGWTGLNKTHALYQSRYLSNEGRLFFNSADALVPQDTNGKEDVYEYEPVGVGSCGPTSEGFSDALDGCIVLISSGTSNEESAFLDASENGDDVFFLTGARLVPQDYDNALDVYDAHVCSQAEPCPTNVTAPPACTTAEACRAAPSPIPGIFGASGSATFSGAGNLVPPASNPVTKPKHAKTKRKGVKRRRKRAHRARVVAKGRSKGGTR